MGVLQYTDDAFMVATELVETLSGARNRRPS